MVKWAYDFSNSVASRMEVLLRDASGLSELRRIQAIYFRARYGDSAVRVAERTGLKLQTVRNLHSRWRRVGEAALALGKKGGRRHTHMSIEEENRLIERHRKAAEKGGILEVGVIHAAYERAVGKPLAKSATYRMLHRHGWRKIAPRPRHPKADQETQEAYKKTGR